MNKLLENIIVVNDIQISVYNERAEGPQVYLRFPEVYPRVPEVYPRAPKCTQGS